MRFVIGYSSEFQAYLRFCNIVWLIATNLLNAIGKHLFLFPPYLYLPT
ncbi:hypothetical protein FDUTEX481_08277 [Tolypothrix sp. PCC 7601]|nr:hypothetical protein FDUTEX481_08277 [Tolypothrix sp. PCC 7601]